MDTCIQACPCFSECSDGCDDCSNSICTCAYPDEDPDYLLCASASETRYMACIGGCNAGDIHCVVVCGANFNTDISNCPCQVKTSSSFYTHTFFSGKLCRWMPMSKLHLSIIESPELVPCHQRRK